jgi:signal transduction histidine kinase
VFGLFERVNEDRSDASGTGLGLALSQRLVEMHGGSIEFTSTDGGGTTFRFRLPNVVVERRQDADATKARSEVRGATAAG